MESYNENNSKNFFLEAMNLLLEIQEHIKQHKDDRIKEVGDRVMIWDGSYNYDKNTGKHRSGIDKLFEKPGIVIETNCGFTHIEKSLDDEIVNLDLLIKFDSGEEVYTKSEYVKRIDNDNI